MLDHPLTTRRYPIFSHRPDEVEADPPQHLSWYQGLARLKTELATNRKHLAKDVQPSDADPTIQFLRASSSRYYLGYNLRGICHICDLVPEVGLFQSIIYAYCWQHSVGLTYIIAPCCFHGFFARFPRRSSNGAPGGPPVVRHSILESPAFRAHDFYRGKDSAKAASSIAAPSHYAPRPRGSSTASSLGVVRERVDARSRASHFCESSFAASSAPISPRPETRYVFSRRQPTCLSDADHVAGPPRPGGGGRAAPNDAPTSWSPWKTDGDPYRDIMSYKTAFFDQHGPLSRHSWRQERLKWGERREVEPSARRGGSPGASALGRAPVGGAPPGGYPPSSKDHRPIVNSACCGSSSGPTDVPVEGLSGEEAAGLPPLSLTLFTQRQPAALPRLIPSAVMPSVPPTAAELSSVEDKGVSLVWPWATRTSAAAQAGAGSGTTATDQNAQEKSIRESPTVIFGGAEEPEDEEHQLAHELLRRAELLSLHSSATVLLESEQPTRRLSEYWSSQSSTGARPRPPLADPPPSRRMVDVNTREAPLRLIFPGEERKKEDLGTKEKRGPGPIAAEVRREHAEYFSGRSLEQAGIAEQELLANLEQRMARLDRDLGRLPSSLSSKTVLPGDEDGHEAVNSRSRSLQVEETPKTIFQDGRGIEISDGGNNWQESSTRIREGLGTSTGDAAVVERSSSSTQQNPFATGAHDPFNLPVWDESAILPAASPPVPPANAGGQQGELAPRKKENRTTGGSGGAGK